jgi:hypothetical protein
MERYIFRCNCIFKDDGFKQFDWIGLPKGTRKNPWPPTSSQKSWGDIILVYLYLQGPSLDWIFPPPNGRAFCKMKCPPITQSPTTGRHYVFLKCHASVFFFLFPVTPFWVSWKTWNKSGVSLNYFGKTRRPISGAMYGAMIDGCQIGYFLGRRSSFIMLPLYLAQWFMSSNEQCRPVIYFFS